MRRVRIRTYGECAESRLTVPAQVSRVHTQQESKQPGRRRRRRGSKVSGELEEENYSATPVCGSLLSPILVRACLCPSSRFCCDETTWEIGTQDVFSDGNCTSNVICNETYSWTRRRSITTSEALISECGKWLRWWRR